MPRSPSSVSRASSAARASSSARRLASSIDRVASVYFTKLQSIIGTERPSMPPVDATMAPAAATNGNGASAALDREA